MGVNRCRWLSCGLGWNNVGRKHNYRRGGGTDRAPHPAHAADGRRNIKTEEPPGGGGQRRPGWERGSRGREGQGAETELHRPSGCARLIRTFSVTGGARSPTGQAGQYVGAEEMSTDSPLGTWALSNAEKGWGCWKEVRSGKIKIFCCGIVQTHTILERIAQ